MNNPTVKILFIGDPHFKVTNLEIIDEFTSQCLQHLGSDIDACVIAGDILHTHERLHTTALNKAVDFINQVRLRCKTYVLVGNHDFENNQQFLSTRHWMNALKEWENTFIIDKPKIIEINKLKFVTIPYVPPGRFVEALNTLDSDWKNVDCIFAHQEFFGCKMGAVESTEGDKWDLMFPFVVSGHIHSEQRPQENIFYPGSVIQHAFGESEDNGILLLTFTTASTGKIEQKMEKIILDIPRMKTVTVKILDFAKLQIAPKKNERLKIICKGSVEEFKSLKKTKLFKKLAMDNSVKIQFKFVQKEGEKGRIKSEFTTFSKILERLILNENNALLTDSYRQLILP